jgi:hypothetical protein
VAFRSPSAPSPVFFLKSADGGIDRHETPTIHVVPVTVF